MPVSKELLEILVCPRCKGEIEYLESPEGFGCHECRLFFPVEDDIPNFLVDEAKEWNPEEKK